MRRIIVFFFVFLILMHCGLYWVSQAYLTKGDPPMLIIIRAEKSGKPFTGTLRLIHKNEDRQAVTLWYQNMAFYIHDNASFEIRSFEILDNSETVLISISENELRYNRNVSIDLDTGRVSEGIGFVKFATGLFASMGPSWIIGEIIVAFFAYYFLFLTPLAFLAMIYSIVREKAAGLKRRFSGSYFRLVFGFAVIGGLIYLAVTSPDEVRSVFRFIMDGANVVFGVIIVYLLVGCGMYVIACRSFNADAIRAQLHRKFDSNLSDMGNYTYTETTWSDGTKTSDEGTAILVNVLIFVIPYIIKTALLPITTYTCMIKYYLVPIVNRDTSWGYLKEYSMGSSAPSESEGYGNAEPIAAPVYSGSTESVAAPVYSGSSETAAAPVHSGGDFSLSGITTQASAPIMHDGVSENVFAYWPSDGYYYPAKITAIYGDKIELQYLDGARRLAEKAEVIDIDSMFSMHVESNWERKGFYYACKFYLTEDRRFIAIYDQDGVWEEVGVDQLRLR